MATVAVVVAAIASSAAGFVFHVATQEKILAWVTEQMKDEQVKPSWDVRYLALLTSVEIGLAYALAYAAIRAFLPRSNLIAKTFLLSVLALALNGRFIRQLIMDVAVGNPFQVAALQSCIVWVNCVLMSIITAIIYERIVSKRRG